MAIWPVGLVNAGHPFEAAAQAYAFGGTGPCRRGRLLPGRRRRGRCGGGRWAPPGHHGARSVRRRLYRRCTPSVATLMRTLIGDAVELAKDTGDYQEFRRQYHARWQQTIMCDSRETVPAAFALATLADGELVRAVEYGANFGRDADTIASMAGALCGATDSDQPLPGGWLDRLGAASSGLGYPPGGTVGPNRPGQSGTVPERSQHGAGAGARAALGLDTGRPRWATLITGVAQNVLFPKED